MEGYALFFAILGTLVWAVLAVASLFVDWSDTRGTSSSFSEVGKPSRKRAS